MHEFMHACARAQSNQAIMRQQRQLIARAHVSLYALGSNQPYEKIGMTQVSGTSDGTVDQRNVQYSGAQQASE